MICRKFFDQKTEQKIIRVAVSPILFRMRIQAVGRRRDELFPPVCILCLAQARLDSSVIFDTGS
jgi:hypothetical protein